MKLTLTKPCLAVAALLFGSLAAQAADLSQPNYKAPAYIGPAYANWTGVYIGINGGYAFGKSDWDFPAVSPSPTGLVAGGTIGYNLQTGAWVWGIEADFDYSGVNGSADCFGDTCETKNDWLATARGRIGYAGWNNWLPYLTGGAAGGDIKASTFFGDATETKIGWTAGAGLEYAISSNLSVKAEYLYVDLGSFDCGIACGGFSPDDVSLKMNIVRAGLNYRF